VLENKLKAANEVIIKQKQLITIGRWVGFMLLIFIGVIFVFKKLLK
jgi:putative Mn2+ efflux pump MntP